MTTPTGSQPTGTSPMKKYGPLIGIVVVILVIAGAVTLAGKKDTGQSNASTTGTGSNGSSATTTGGANGAPITYELAKKEGKESSIQWVDNCDPATGRIKVPSVFAPACVPKYSGNNGGATGQGVTADKVTIVVYTPPDNADILSRFTSQLDSKEATKETGERYAEMFQNLYQTYGRKVELVQFDATGAPNDPVAAQADAVNVVEKYHPFASLGGPVLTPAYAEELARQKVLCMGCGVSLPDQFYQDHSPYIWGPLPTPEQFLVNLGDYITNRVVGRNASFAGDDDLKNKKRTFGVVHFEQDPPVFSGLNEQVAACGKQRGWDSQITETYTFDIGKMPERATTIIAKMKAAGITSIIFLGDPIMPIYLTQQATAQNYHPEWIVTGTVLTDTTVLGRMYDQSQWTHAFGMSNLAARTPREVGDAWHLHEWYYGKPPTAANTSGIIYPPLQQMFLGIHMAGPNLSAETFKQGMFNYPESGGGATNPHVSYGDHGYFKLAEGTQCTSDKPRPDYLGVDDVTEIWWDANAEGPDEQGKTDKKGMWRYANNGKRYLPGQMPKTDLDAFKMENTITVLKEQPAGEAPPDYPSPAKK
jgi:hypothetical protein